MFLVTLQAFRVSTNIPFWLALIDEAGVGLLAVALPRSDVDLLPCVCMFYDYLAYVSEPKVFNPIVVQRHCVDQGHRLP